MTFPFLTPWFERQFPSVSNEFFPGLLERLEGTSIRIRSKLEEVPLSVLKKRQEGRWSIQEHIGHLGDLEPLWLGRVEDIRAEIEVMRPADLGNQKTHEADHNEQEIEKLIFDFQQGRQKLLAALGDIEFSDLEKSAKHPRLMTPMRLVDLMAFVAEHDDHHLAVCSELIRKKI